MDNNLGEKGTDDLAPPPVRHVQRLMVATGDAGAALRREAEHLAPLLDISPVAVAITDLDATVVAWNPAAEELFGYTAEKAIGRNLDDLVAKTDELHQKAVAYTEVTRTGTVRTATQRTRKDGSLVDVELVAAPLVVDGETVGTLGIYHDITEINRQSRFLEALLQVSPEAIVTVDVDDTVTSWNPAAEQLFGYTAEEAIGRNIDDLVARPDDLYAEAKELSGDAIEGPTAHRYTQRTRKDGSLVDVDIVGGPVTVGGELVAKHVFYHDIGELQRQKRYFQALVELSPTAIVVTDFDGTVTNWNPGAERLFGYTAEEAIGRDLDDLVADRDELRDEARANTQAAARGERVEGIARRTRKDGSLVDVSLVSAPVVVGEERLGFLVIYHDISELQRQRRYYEALVESSPVAIALLDPEGTVTSWNPSAERLFGYTEEEAIGSYIDDLVATSPEVRSEAESQTEQGMSGGFVHMITRRTRKDGTLIDVEMFGAPVLVAGEPAGLYAMYHDVGELQQARREAEAATRAKSAFLATMSHEIRTPLNAVIGMTGLLLDTELGAEQRDYAEVIRSSGEALLEVINEILDFSKIEAGKLELESEPFDLRQCVESAVDLVATAATQKGLELAYLVPEHAPASVVGDVTRLRQVLLNLMNNAVKFTDAGEVVATVDAERAADGGDQQAARWSLHFAVRDTGIGIPEDRMHRLFESFSQVDASTTRRYGGTGLGLAISRRLVELMDGRMWAESRPGEGSTFHFTVTLQEAPAHPRAAPPAPGALEGRRVLIVDDNATNREILRRQTRGWGMAPHDTGSPHEALEWVVRGDPFDLGILDMQMPEMDGRALAAEIRRYRDRDALPLVMLTSLGRRDAAELEEFAAHLTKPVKASQLLDALTTVLAADVVATEDLQPTGQRQAGEEVLAPLRILVAEDSAVNQRLALLMLKKLGYRADVAADGEEAVAAVERQAYDVVLMDVHMPNMDGLEATRRIRARFGSRDGPRIVAMTAGVLEEDREATIHAGMDDFISKPIRQEDLAAALRRAAPPKGAGEPATPDALARLRATLGDDDLAELVEAFITETDALLPELRRAVAEDRIADARREAHSLKGSSAAFGQEALSALSRRLEELAASDSLDGAEDLLSAIEDEYARVRTTLIPPEEDRS